MSSPFSSPALAARIDPPERRLLSPAFALLVGVQVCFGLSFSTFFLLPKFVLLDLHGDAHAIGMVMATAALSGVITAPLLGRWLDQGRRAPFVTAGTLITALSAIGFVWVDEVGPLAYGLRIVQGVAFSMVFNATATLVSDLAPPARLGQAFGWFGAAALSTNAIAPVTAEWIAHAYGWPAVFWAAAGIGFCACLLSLFVSDAAPLSGSGAALGDLGAALRRRSSVFYAMATGGAAFGVMFSFTQPFAVGLGEERVSGLFLGYTVAAVFVRLAFGGVADRIGRRKVAIGSLTLYACVVAATAALVPGWLPLFGLGFGAAHGLFYPALSAFTIEGAPRAQRGTLTALVNAGFNLGSTVSVAAGGLFARSTSYELVFVLTGLLTMSGVVALARK